MPTIHLNTIIHAPIEKVFDAARSIDLHQESMQHTNEKAVAGITKGLINLNETVTWEAKHLFMKRNMTVKITAMQPHIFFKDEMLEGDFKLMQHEHHFKTIPEGTEMKDVFHFESPYGIFGKIFNQVFLTNYMKRLLTQRNVIIKQAVETHP
jgi:ligand-binding SRPBCC domain-containing protein